MKTKFLLCTILLSSSLNAAPLQGLHFAHEDWELACDNTGTCRAAGYQREEDSFRRSISLLLTRQAGEHAPIKGKMSVLAPQDADGNTVAAFTFSRNSQLLLNNQSLGSLKINSDGMIALSAKQTAILLQALKKHSKIQFKSGQYTWELSDKGAAAVLLKADEFQQRLNTPNAWIKTGSSTHKVLQPQAKPKIQAVAVPQKGAYTLQVNQARHTALLNILRAANRQQGEKHECAHLQNDEYQRSIEVYPLSKNKVLVETSCIEGAYQTTMFYAVMDKSLTKIDYILPHEYGGFGDFDPKKATLSASFKGRGLGDCWSSKKAVWNGTKFVKTDESASQMCRGFTGGIWDMPTWVSDVVGSK